MMPMKTTNNLRRSNSFYEAGSLPYSKVKHKHDCFSSDAIDVVKCKNGELNAPVGWCGGDSLEEVGDHKVDAGDGQVITFRDVSEEVRYKDTLIDELQKSNHQLRIKFAEAENKIAQLRLKIEAHCGCCSRGLGVEDFAERKNYNEWSSVHSLGIENIHQLNPMFWNSRDYNGMASDTSPYLNKATDDILNPYVKVKRWQDALDSRYGKETDSSTGSTYALKCNSRPLSPNFSLNYVSARSAPIPRDKSPCSGFTNEYNPPSSSRTTTPATLQHLGLLEDTSRDNKKYSYQRKSFELAGNTKVDSGEDPITRRLLKESAKSTPGEWVLSSGNEHRQSDSSLSTNNDNCQLNSGSCEKREQLMFMNQYNNTMRQYSHKSWDFQEHNNPRFKRWSPLKETTTGIVGGLMKTGVDQGKQD